MSHRNFEGVTKRSPGGSKPEPAGPRDGAKASRSRARRLPLLRRACLLLALAALAGFLSWRVWGFLDPNNLAKLAVDVSLFAIAGVGMTAAIAGGGLDVSVGSVLAVCAACSALAVRGGAPVAAGVAMAVALGAGLGAVNGALSALSRLPSILVTLVTMFALRWVFLAVLGGGRVEDVPAGVAALARFELLGLQGIVWVAAGAVAAGAVLLRRHGAPGVRTRGRSVVSFAAGGATVGLAAILWAGEYGAVGPDTGRAFALPVIAAAVVGGAGSALGAAAGALLVGMAYNGMILLGVDAGWQNAAFGALVVAALLFDWLLRAFVERSGKPAQSDGRSAART